MPRISCEAFVARRGFEPRQTEPKSVVLPLYYRAKKELFKRDAKIRSVKRPSKFTQPQSGNNFSSPFEQASIYYATVCLHQFSKMDQGFYAC